MYGIWLYLENAWVSDPLTLQTRTFDDFLDAQKWIAKHDFALPHARIERYERTDHVRR